MSHNTWIHRAVRGAVRPLVDTPVTPNHLTALRLASGLGAAWLVAFAPQSVWGWAAALFLVSLFLDRADGELARLGGKSTPWGHTFDLLADGTCNAVIFFALGLGLSGGALGDWAILMGLVAGLSVTAVVLIVLRLEAMAGERAGEVPGFAGFDPDDGMVTIPIMLWLGLADWLLVAAAVGTPVFALILISRFRRALQSS